MNRVWTLNSQSVPPVIPSSLEVGYPKDTGGATTPGFWWYHLVTETLMHAVVTGAGLTASNSDLTQLTQAIGIIAKNSVTVGSFKPCRVLDTTGPTTGTRTVDGITLVNGDRVLVNLGTSASGIYVYNSAGAWTRATDMATAAAVSEGMLVPVCEGSAANTKTVWVINSVSGGVITVGTTAFGLTSTVAYTQSLLSNYLTTASASSTYATIASLSSYLTTATAASTYLTQSNAASTYLTQTNAANTYDTITARNSALSAYLTTSSASSTYATISYVQGNPQTNSLGVGTAADGTAGDIRATGTITGSFSDDRLKDRERELTGEEALAILEATPSFYYTPNAYAQQLGRPMVREIGNSAQDFEKVLPEVVAVSGLHHTPDRAEEEALKTLRYERVVPVLSTAVTYLRKKLQARDLEMAKLREDMDRLINTARSKKGM